MDAGADCAHCWSDGADDSRQNRRNQDSSTLSRSRWNPSMGSGYADGCGDGCGGAVGNDESDGGGRVPCHREDRES